MAETAASIPVGGGDQFSRARVVGPCLYIWRRGDLVLYVGEFALGATRAFNHSFGNWGSHATDEVEILPRPGATKKQLRQEEAALIARLLPIWNAIQKPGQRRKQPDAAERAARQMRQVADRSVGSLAQRDMTRGQARHPVPGSNLNEREAS